MRSDLSRALSEVAVGEVGDCFGHDAECRRGLPPAHRARHRDGHELRFSFVLGEDDGEARTVGGLEEHAVEPVLDVVLGEVDRTELGVRVSDALEHSV